MGERPVKAQDLLKDDEDYKTIKGVRVRKGTIAATIKNIAKLESANSEQRAAILDAIKENAPALVALDVHRYFECRNKEVERILVKAAMSLNDSKSI
ncbi:hypothetical protein [Microbulbifer sp. DLAB2-AA]|uniref:hypothetical protein n=1 Tax=Microbulbifer sp. DLAB2-AA TaxID=3243394 RepID=UPI0040393FDB